MEEKGRFEKSFVGFSSHQKAKTDRLWHPSGSRNHLALNLLAQSDRKQLFFSRRSVLSEVVFNLIIFLS